MTWKELVHSKIFELCNDAGSRTFTLKDLLDRFENEFLEFRPSNVNAIPKVRQQLQYLRNDGVLGFMDRRGTYTLKNMDVLAGEVEEESMIQVIKSSPPEKKEYLLEVFARDRGWVSEAKSRFGCYCLYPRCANHFLKPDGEPYIEVHHILPLCEGGEDSLWNLAVVCAHHHRMAHFADTDVRAKLKEVLLREVGVRLS